LAGGFGQLLRTTRGLIGGELGWSSGFVADAEAGVPQSADQLAGTEYLRGAGIDQGCVEGFCELLANLFAHRVS
jgi:hypothetical protein